MDCAVGHPDRKVFTLLKRFRLKPKTNVVPDLGRCEVESPLTSGSVGERSYRLGLALTKTTNPRAPRRRAPGVRIYAASIVKRNDKIIANRCRPLRVTRFTRQLEVNMEVGGHLKVSSPRRCDARLPIR